MVDTLENRSASAALFLLHRNDTNPYYPKIHDLLVRFFLVDFSKKIGKNEYRIYFF